MKHTLLVLGLMVICLSGCNKDDDNTPVDTPDYTERDEQIIQDYFIENNITDTIADPSGVYIKHLEEGTGDKAADATSIRVLYTGYYLPSEIVFDNAQEPVWFELDGLIEGWAIGIPYMKKGGKATLYIPSRYAYGTSVLKFNITLVDFTTE